MTFNGKDYERYLRRWPEIWIYFFVRWDVRSYPYEEGTITVPFVHGV